MKYKIYIEQEYKDFSGDLEPDREIEYYLRLEEVKQRRAQREAEKSSTED